MYKKKTLHIHSCIQLSHRVFKHKPNSNVRRSIIQEAGQNNAATKNAMKQ